MKMQKIITFIFTALIFVSVNNSFGQNKWQVNSSKIKFKIKNAGFYVDGSFSNLKADIQFDPQTLKGEIYASIEASTVDTDSKSRDKHLRAEEYFDVEKHAKITMKTNKFARSQSGNYIGYFDLTIKGVTKQVTVPFSFKDNTFKANFTINRLDYGVGKSNLILNDNVKLDIEVQVSSL